MYDKYSFGKAVGKQSYTLLMQTLTGTTILEFGNF